jgi:hypothetical protein
MSFHKNFLDGLGDDIHLNLAVAAIRSGSPSSRKGTGLSIRKGRDGGAAPRTGGGAIGALAVPIGPRHSLCKGSGNR